MKLAFSTLGCPDFSWSEITSMAKDCGFQGIEVRGMGEGLRSIKGSPFTEENRLGTKEKLQKMRLEIPCFSTGCALKCVDKAEETKQEIEKYIRLANQMETPYLRILADSKAEADGEVDDSAVLSLLTELVTYAESYDVTLLVETNGVYADTKRLANLLNNVASDNVGALWDINHPYRFRNELPEETVQNLGAYIKYVHVKDSVMENGRLSYRMMGEGNLPIESAMFSLRSINYEGYVSLEWLKSYAPDLNDAAIVFPHFINYMSAYISKQDQRGKLQDNIRKTGKYIWPKEQLIDLTFPQVLDRMVEEFPDQYAFRYTTLDYTRTYSQFRDDVDDFARALISMGVKAGDHVAIWATNIQQWYITFWATTKIGAVLITVNTAYKIHEAEYLLRQSDTHTLIMTEGTKTPIMWKLSRSFVRNLLLTSSVSLCM